MGLSLEIDQITTLVPMLVQHKLNGVSYKAIMFYDQVGGVVFNPHGSGDVNEWDRLCDAVLEYITSRQSLPPVIPVEVDEMIEKAHKVETKVANEWEQYAREAEFQDRNTKESGTDGA